MSRVRTTRLCQIAFLGFLVLTTCSVPVFSDVIPSQASPASSVETSESSQLVASASARDEGLGPVQPLALGGSEDKKNGTADGGERPDLAPPPALEAGDMMKDPYHNITVGSSDRDEEALINNDTVVVNDPHVSLNNKTHEEDGDSSTETPVESSTQQVREETTVPDSSPTPSTEGSIDKDKETDGEISVPEMTSPPVSPLVSHYDTHDHPAISKSSPVNHTTQAAAFLAGALVVIAIMGYMGMLLWRRVLEKRYGNREMLVNDDEDFKHFEL